MDKKDGTPAAVTPEENTVPQQIQAFAAKLGEEVGNSFSVYIYRIIHDEETGKRKKPFVKKYIGIEPDPQEIAEKFRAGTYLIQFIWYVKGSQKTQAYCLDVDADAFPPLQKNNSLVPYGSAGSPGMSEAATLQLATFHEIADIMKAAYASNGPGGNGRAVQTDPLEMFGGMMETMENGFSRAMTIQSAIMERVFTRNMEKQYGLIEDVTPGPAGTGPGPEGEAGIIGKYAPIVREIVDGLKTVMGFFGTDVPAEVVKKVTGDNRFKTLLKDQKALVVIGQALRREFGNDKAAKLMNTFGVRMVLKQGKAEPVAQTPPIAVLQGGQGQGTPANGGKPVPAAKVIKTTINGGNGKARTGNRARQVQAA